MAAVPPAHPDGTRTPRTRDQTSLCDRRRIADRSQSRSLWLPWQEQLTVLWRRYWVPATSPVLSKAAANTCDVTQMERSQYSVSSPGSQEQVLAAWTLSCIFRPRISVLHGPQIKRQALCVK